MGRDTEPDGVEQAMKPRVVAVVGTRVADLAIEEAALRPVGAMLRAGAGASADEIVEIAGDADVILAGSGPWFEAATLRRLKCRGIVRYGVGVDRIDLGAAREHGIWVARVADYGTEAVALHAVTLALAGLRRLREADARMRAGDWGFADLGPLHLPASLTAGIVGYGRIGRRVGDLLAALGFRVLAHDPLVPATSGPAHPPEARQPAPTPANPLAGALPVPLEDLLASADVVSLHAPAPLDGQPLLDADRLALLRPGSVLVNTARGALVDPKALAAGLRAGRPRVAALDVFSPEPPDLSIFAEVLDRMILTPHMAWYTDESERALREKAAEAARRLLVGERPDDVVVEPA